MADVDLTLDEGEFLSIIGPNGAGKTTLFDCIAGVRRPKAGTITLEGRDITNAPAVTRARLGITRTFQRQQVFGRLTVEENLLTATEWHGGGGGILADLVAFPPRKKIERRRREAVNDVLGMCGLEPFRHTIGTARMVELGRALAEAPSLLLLDEPTSGLGGAEGEHLSEVIRRLRGELSCAILLVEHDITFVMSHCDRIVVLQLGEVLAEGTPSEIQANPEVRNAYLG